jgi:Ca2+:H+ antiporter
MNRIFIGMLAFVPVALVSFLIGAPPISLFILSALALVPLAKFIGDATEELASYTTPAIGGLVNATFGNATELLIGLFALSAGLGEVVKGALTGAIIGNLLLVLGTAMLVGGRKRVSQKFNPTIARAAGSMLILATIGLVIPAMFLATSGAAGAGLVQNLSVLVSILMICAYGASLFFSLHTHKHLFQAEAALIKPKWSVRKSIGILFGAVVGAAAMSEVLVSAITPLVTVFGWSQLFIGVVVVAIVGNVAEHFSAVVAAHKDRMDLSFQIAIGSATQIVMFVAPVLVLLSLFMPHRMDLVFNTFELVAIIFSVFVANAVLNDGESNWLEGVQLLIAYIIMAIAFFLHP